MTNGIRFSDQAKVDLSKAERLLADTVPLLDKAEECGVECDFWRETIRTLQRHIEALRRHFPQINDPLDPAP